MSEAPNPVISTIHFDISLEQFEKLFITTSVIPVVMRCKYSRHLHTLLSTCCYNLTIIKCYSTCMDPDGGRVSCTPPPTPPPPKNHKTIGFIAIVVRISRKITYIPSQHSMLGHHPLVSQMAFLWQADDGLILVVFLFLSPLTTYKKSQAWTPSDKTFWICTWFLMPNPLYTGNPYMGTMTNSDP